MTQLFADLGPLLLQYKNSNALCRQAILMDVMAGVKKLPGKVRTKNQAKLHYKELSYAATRINYADVLQRMENQQYFEILFDFYDMEMDEKLCSWFEFSKTPGQMRLKHPIHEYTPQIWEKFRAAQKAHLQKTNKSHLFHLDQLDIRHPPANQLYPLQIQMGGKLENEAVDRINVNTQGQIRFAQRFDFYLLPGGGMIEINNNAKIEDLKRKMLEEHLEEEHANLYIKAAELYDQLSRDAFNDVLIKVFACEQAQSLSLELQSWLKEQAVTEASNSIRLKRIIVEIDRQIAARKKQDTLKKPMNEERVKKQNMLKSLIELRAIVQVQTFKLTPLFAEAFAYIKENTITVDIQQYLDTRVLGGTQISHSFIMTGQPLEDWFLEKFKNIDGELGDDLSEFEIKRLTLLEALNLFRKVKYSHILIGLAAYQECFENKTLHVDNVWDNDQFEHARKVILEEVSRFF